MQIMLIAIGGAIGAILRYLVSIGVYGIVGKGFPYGTLVVNVTGCLLMGFLATLLLERYAESAWLRSFVLIGILGGYTTFSSFALETFNLMQREAIFAAMMNVFFSVFLCLIAVVVGFILARML